MLLQHPMPQAASRLLPDPTLGPSSLAGSPTHALALLLLAYG
jgi:hypothetical protein